jgi:GTP cyclohydrolase IA
VTADLVVPDWRHPGHYQEELPTAGAVRANGNRPYAHVEAHVAALLRELDPTGPRQGTERTPQRVARMYLDELCNGYAVDIAGLFRAFDNDGYDGMVVVKDIPFTSLCEHHLVPFIGYAHVGYYPDGRVVGLSKIARVVEAYARRLQIQERLTKQVAEAVEVNLGVLGVMVMIEAEHMCMMIRGVQKPGTRTVTTAANGLFAANESGERAEFHRLIGRQSP